MANNKFLFMLGLCRKAGQMIIGTDLVTKSLPSGKVKLVIYAKDSSDNTKKRVTDKCAFYKVKCIESSFSSEEISSCIGKAGNICVLGIVNDNFSNELLNISNETR